MDLGFGEDFCQEFEDMTVKRRNRLVADEELLYMPKLTVPLWFNDAHSLDDSDVKKNVADHKFYLRDYTSAMQIYKELLEDRGLAKSARSELLESVHVCQHNLNSQTEAELSASQQHYKVYAENCKNSDQKTTSLYLKLTSNAQENLERLHKLILIHPYNHYVWLDLTKTYECLGDRCRYIISLLRTRLLFEMNYQSISSFIEEKHQAYLNQVLKLCHLVKSELQEETFTRLSSAVKSKDAEIRINEDWQNEQYKLDVLSKSPCETESIVQTLWYSLYSDITSNINFLPSMV